MARITVEDCLTKETNRFALVQLAARRTKQILNGAKVLTPESKGNKAVVTSLREIADGLVAFMSEEELQKLREKERREREEALAAEEAKRQEAAAKAAAEAPVREISSTEQTPATTEVGEVAEKSVESEQPAAL